MKQIKIKPRYSKKNGQMSIDIDRNELPFEVKDKAVVYIPPKAVAGNHIHSRQEALVCLGENVDFIWLDKAGKQRITKMHQRGQQLIITIVPSGVPHAVRNNSTSQPAILIEYADEQITPATQQPAKVI